jgi:hypothetical protein
MQDAYQHSYCNSVEKHARTRLKLTLKCVFDISCKLLLSM